MTIRDILRRNNSNIAPIARMGRPVKSKASRYAAMMPENDTRLGYLKHGNLISGLTSGAKGYLGFKGARQDYEAEQAYNNYLAQVAEQERQERLAQQAAEMDYKDRVLAQQAALAQEQLAAKKAEQDALFAHQKELENLKNEHALSMQNAQLKNANNTALLQHRQTLREQGIDPDLYGVDPEYTALINDALRQLKAQEQVNAATVELGKSGKVGMDKVSEAVATGKPITFDDNGWFANMIGWNKYGLGKAPKTQPKTIADVNREYANRNAVPQVDYSKVSNEDLLKGL